MDESSLYYVRYSATQSELSTRMLKDLGAYAQTMDRCVFSGTAAENLTKLFSERRDMLAKETPRAKKVEHIGLTEPTDRYPGWLTADGVTLLTIVPVRHVVIATSEALQMKQDNLHFVEI